MGLKVTANGFDPYGARKLCVCVCVCVCVFLYAWADRMRGVTHHMPEKPYQWEVSLQLTPPPTVH